MNIERLKMWELALIEAAENGRKFDFKTFVRPVPVGESPCGFTACLAGDLAFYEPARDLGFAYTAASDECDDGDICFGRYDGPEALVQFLDGDRSRSWIYDTIIPSYARRAYDKPVDKVTREDGLARIRAKIAELETA